jgi:hypothetical protein
MPRHPLSGTCQAPAITVSNFSFCPKGDDDHAQSQRSPTGEVPPVMPVTDRTIQANIMRCRVSGGTLQERSAMATIEYKDGAYSIAPQSNQTFTFWWGRNSKAPHEYFDVSITPDNFKETPMKPLIQEQKRVYLDTSEGPARVVIALTLRNENNFAVDFLANHVRIY